MQDFQTSGGVVTGASTGIGEAIAAELFRRGATVVMTAATKRLRRRRALDPEGRRVMTLRMDVREAPSVQQGIEESAALRRAASAGQQFVTGPARGGHRSVHGRAIGMR